MKPNPKFLRILGTVLLTCVIVATTAHADLLHRYSFNETSGITASDSVGGANGTVVNNSAAFNGTGQLVLTGNGGSDYVALPSGLITNQTSVSFEVWFTEANVAQPFARLFDFGDSDGTLGLDYVLLSFPNGGALHGQINNNANSLDDNPAPSAGVEHHAVFTIDHPNHKAALYVDGQFVVGNTSFTLCPTNVLPMLNCWLGRSQFSADNYYN